MEYCSPLLYLLRIYLPHQPQWHILVTSREQIENFDLKGLDFLSEDDAIALFLTHYRRDNLDRGQIRDIVLAVDLHTLAIEILAKTAHLQRTRPHELMQAIKNDIKANVYVRHKGDKIDSVTSYLCTIFALSKLDRAELWVLKQFACLPPEFQSYDLLKELIEIPPDSDSPSLSEILETLSSKGWLLENIDSYKMHRIIAVVIRKQAPSDMSESQLLEIITEKLEIDQTKDNPVEKFPWIPYGHALLAVFPLSNEPAISKLQNNLALVLCDLGDYEGAGGLLEKALASDEKNFGKDHPNTARSYSNLATVLCNLGDYERALSFSKKSVEIFKKCLPEGHPNIKIVCKIYDGIKQQISKVSTT